MIQAGSRVRFSRMPEWVRSLPERSRRVFEFCLRRTYTVEEVDEQGLFVLDVSGDIDERFGGFRNDIRVDAKSLLPLPVIHDECNKNQELDKHQYLDG